MPMDFVTEMRLYELHAKQPTENINYFTLSLFFSCELDLVR
jgi:hypothetical protein